MHSRCSLAASHLTSESFPKGKLQIRKLALNIYDRKKKKVESESEIAQSCRTLCDPMDPLSMEFPRQEYWSGQPFPSPGDLLNSGIKHASPALQAGDFTV